MQSNRWKPGATPPPVPADGGRSASGCRSIRSAPHWRSHRRVGRSSVGEAGATTRSQEQLILVLDAGGTSTRAVLARSDGTVLGRGRAGPGNHILSGWEPARRALADSITQACVVGRTAPAAVTCVLAGSAGVGPNGEGREIVESLLREIAPQATVRAVGDMVTAFAGALRGECGVVIVAGTGSVCYGRDAAGNCRQVGGWGPLLGDEGSAYDIALRGLRAGARATDGRAPPSELTQRIPAAMGLTSFVDVALRAYAQPLGRDAIAGLARTVADAAKAGDAVARDILATAGHELALAVVTTLRALALEHVATPVAYMGGVFAAGAPVLEPFQQAVRSACPAATIVAAEFPPVIGAFKLALGEIALPFTAAAASTLYTALGGEGC